MSVNVLAVGDNVVDRYVDQALMYPGGNAVNVAVHAHRCGLTSGYVGAVGTDLAGRTVLDALVEEGVDTSLLRVLDGTNAYAEVRVVDGNRVFGQADAGVSRIRLGTADLEAAARADVVHTGECSMIEDQLPELAASSRRLSFDFSERPWEYVERHARYADVAVRSAPRTSLARALDDAHRLRALGPEVVAVTLGAEGAVVVDGRDVVRAQAGDAVVVDTLGAGDAFIARLLVGLVRGEPLHELVPAATAYASVSCSSYGAFGYATSTQDGADATSFAPAAPQDRTARHSRTAPLDIIQHGGVDQP